MPNLPIPSLQEIVFLSLSLLAITAALVMITRNDAVHSALALVVVLFQLAGMYVLLNAAFLAVLQVLVYAGAILVLFLFVIMLLQIREGPALPDLHRIQRVVAWPIGVLLGLELVGVILLATAQHTLAAPPIPAGLGLSNPGGGWPAARITQYGNEPRALGIELYTSFLLPFEVASLILLVAVVGAIVLASREDLLGKTAMPALGISLGRRVVTGSPQAAEVEKVLARDVPGVHLVTGLLGGDAPAEGPPAPVAAGAQPTGDLPSTAARPGEDTRLDG